MYVSNKNINYYDSHLIAMKITVANAFAILECEQKELQSLVSRLIFCDCSTAILNFSRVFSMLYKFNTNYDGQKYFGQFDRIIMLFHRRK